MTYWAEEHFDEPRKLIEYFLWNNWFITTDKFSATAAGKNGMIFRGQANADWELVPSAFRPGRLKLFTAQPPWDPAVSPLHLALGTQLHAEQRAIHIFLQTADSLGIQTPLDYSRIRDDHDLVMAALANNLSYDYTHPFPSASLQRATALAQHHGVPTRFLDWTEDPFVAAYFAAYEVSSFGTPVPGQKISIVFASADAFSREKSPVELIKAPRFENANLRQQRGIFTNIKGANDYFLKHKTWPSVNEVAVSGDYQLHRVTLPGERADDLLRLLFDLKISRHTLMPNLDNAARTYQYIHTLFGP